MGVGRRTLDVSPLGHRNLLPEQPVFPRGRIPHSLQNTLSVTRGPISAGDVYHVSKRPHGDHVRLLLVWALTELDDEVRKKLGARAIAVAAGISGRSRAKLLSASRRGCGFRIWSARSGWVVAAVVFGLVYWIVVRDYNRPFGIDLDQQVHDAGRRGEIRQAEDARRGRRQNWILGFATIAVAIAIAYWFR